MKKNYTAISLILFAHFLFCVVWIINGDGFFPFYFVYLVTLPGTVALAGVVDMIIGVFAKDLFCRLISIASGICSFLVIMYLIMNRSLPTKNMKTFISYIMVAIVVCACWVTRGIVYHKAQRKGQYHDQI